MKTKPILFSTPMVQAILEGHKTQTRRIVKLPIIEHARYEGGAYIEDKNKDRYGVGSDDLPSQYKKGDILWVRETWQQVWNDEDDIPNFDKRPKVPAYGTGNCHFIYRSDGEIPDDKLYGKFLWKPSIFMPKEACRIFLQVTGVKVERFRDITREDAIAEGVDPVQGGYLNYLTGKPIQSPKLSFETLWTSIYGPHSYDYNPWVWVYSFQQIEKPRKFEINGK